jgi:hypothetical protein
VDALAIRRFAGRALVAGLSLAAFVAVIALLAGDLDDTAGRVILSSIGFALCSAIGSSGAAARLRGLEWLGTLTLACAAVAFVLLLAGLWTGDWGSEGIWRAFGLVAVTGLAGAHACAMLGARRRTDSDAVRRLTIAALWLGAFDAFGAVLPISGLASDVDEVWGRIFGAGLVLLVLASVLPSVLRRMDAGAPAATRTRGDDSFASQVVEAADRIALLNADPGMRAPEIRAEVERLRKLAQSHES